MMSVYRKYNGQTPEAVKEFFSFSWCYRNHSKNSFRVDEKGKTSSLLEKKHAAFKTIDKKNFHC